jgi:hypothetical protein
MARRPYLRDRLIEEMPEGFVVIVPTDASLPVPLFCPICDFVMRTKDDETAYREFECCDRCSRKWAAPRKKAWKDGWRPSREQVADAEADRVPLSITFDVD